MADTLNDGMQDLFVHVLEYQKSLNNQDPFRQSEAEEAIAKIMLDVLINHGEQFTAFLSCVAEVETQGETSQHQFKESYRRRRFLWLESEIARLELEEQQLKHELKLLEESSSSESIQKWKVKLATVRSHVKRLNHEYELQGAHFQKEKPRIVFKGKRF